MSVRFNRDGTTHVKDHNELINRGVRTHAEIDSYMDELDEVRGSDSSIHNRFVRIEEKNTEQDNTISGIQNDLSTAQTDITSLRQKDFEHDSKIAAIEQKNIQQDQAIAQLQEDIQNGTGTNQEVVEARTDRNGTVYPDLKARLDEMQTQIGAGGGGGGGGGMPLTQVDKFGVVA